MKRWILVAVILPLTMLSWAQSQGEWASRAYTYMEQDSLAQAEECFRHAVEATPASKQNVMLLTNLGTVPLVFPILLFSSISLH